MRLSVPENFRYDLFQIVDENRERFGKPHGTTGDFIDDPPPELLDQALGGMHEGTLEYVTLEAGGDLFLQAAGSGDGPYQLERRFEPDGPLVAAEGPVAFDLVRRAMHAYLAGAPDPADLRWGRAVGPPPRKGLLRKIFGSSD